MIATEIFQKLHKSKAINYDNGNYSLLLNEFAPGLLDQYLASWQGHVVYIWRDGADVIYVGKSKSWKNRLISHLVEMLCQQDFMYQHFFRAHEAGTLSVELHKVVIDIDALEQQKIVELSCPTMYNVEYNPNQPCIRFATQSVPAPLFTTPEEARAFFLKLDTNKFAAAEWQKDPRYEVLKPRLKYDGARVPTGVCEHCQDRKTFTKLIAHEDECLYRLTVVKLLAIKTRYRQAKNKGKYLLDAAQEYKVNGTQLTKMCKGIGVPTKLK